MLLKYMSIPIFIASFLIGLIFIYLYGPETKNIYIYPSPDNYKEILITNIKFKIDPLLSIYDNKNQYNVYWLNTLREYEFKSLFPKNIKDIIFK